MKLLLQKLKKAVKLPDFIPVLAVLFLGVLAARPLFSPGYFTMHDDLQMMRQLSMEKCILDGQIPCRWTPDMGYGFGFPLFNYYPPLPYLVGQGIRFLGFTFVDTVKAAFALSFVLSGLAMYVFAREIFLPAGRQVGRFGGVLSSAFYIWGPYRATDVYVRGAMNESWSFVFFPLALWASYKLVKEAQFRWIIILTLSWFGLFTSHNLMALIFLPLFAAWVLLWLVKEKSWFTLPQLIVSGLWAFGLAAFFTLPVLLEKNLVHVETLVVGYYEYIAHFASLRQLLITRFWGYGASYWGDDDAMAFQVGHLHWVLPLLIAGFVLWRLLKSKKPLEKLLKSNTLLLVLFFFAAGWFATFMAHQRSIFIWQAIPPLTFVQFPWRFLTLTTLSFSFLVGALPSLFREEKIGVDQRLLLVVLITSAVLLGKDYFKPEKIGALTTSEKFEGRAWEMQQTAGIFDYLPNTAETAPKDPQTVLAQIIEGEGKVTHMVQGTDWAKFRVNVTSENALVRVNILKFPNWRVFARPAKASAKGGGWKEVEARVLEDKWGRMDVEVPSGEHEVVGRLYDTPVRTTGNIISLFSWLLLLTAPVWRRR